MSISPNPKALPRPMPLRMAGLSGILCARLVSLLTYEPFAKDNGELGPCFVTVIGSDLTNAEGKLFDELVDG